MHSTSPLSPPPASTTTTSTPFPPRDPPPTTTTTTLSKAKTDRNVQNVVLGDIPFPTWYSSLYPEELVGGKVERLYVCQWCFKYSREVWPFVAHMKLCPSRSGVPPGRLIYTRDTHAIYEVDGEEHQLFTQNLSLFAKLFLDNKSVFYDVSSFKYYLLLHTPTPTPNPNPNPSPSTRQVIGFFSKEKMSWDNNNLACILIFPPWQRRGFGKILMGISYELSRREGRIGGPEKPLSEMGKRGYTRFWEATVARFVLGPGGVRGREREVEAEAEAMMTVGEIARRCWVLPEDVIVALKGMGLLGDLTRWERKLHGGSRMVVVINRNKVREWVHANGVDLEAPVLEEGFVEEEEDGEEEDEEGGVGGREG